jgi:hypothetical protein
VLNPAFDPIESATGSTTRGTEANTLEVSGSTVDGGSATGPDGSDDDRGTTSSGTTRAASTSGGSASASESESESESGSACRRPPDARIHFTLREQNRAVVEPECGDAFSFLGLISVSGEVLELSPCTDCPCTNASALPITIDFGDSVVVPPLPACGSVVAWAQDGDGTCDWAGFAVIRPSAQPEWVAANTRVLPASVGGGKTIALVDDVPCATVSCTTAGTKRLAFADGEVGVDDEPTVVTIGFFAGETYEVDNRMCFVDAECGEQIAWTALRSP